MIRKGKYRADRRRHTMHDYAQGQWSNFAKESKFDVLVHDNEKKTDHVTS